jgi:hypothetical protein
VTCESRDATHSLEREEIKENKSDCGVRHADHHRYNESNEAETFTIKETQGKLRSSIKLRDTAHIAGYKVFR